jgi:Xaa-Pro aminopeptidase
MSRTAAKPATAKRPAPGRPTDPGPPFSGRLQRLRGLLPGAGVDHVLVTNPIDVGYLTGFLGGDSFLLVGPAKPLIVSDFRYWEELEPLKPIADVLIRTKGMNDTVADVVRERGVQRLGVQGEHMTLAERDALVALVGARRIAGTTGLVASLRITKDDHELKLIRTAIKIQQDALNAVLPIIKPGDSETEVAARLEAEMKTRGSSQPGFQSIIAAGTNGSLPHYRPGRAKVKANQPVLIDWGAVYQGYHGDMTRVFALRKWPAKIREIYGIVLEAQMSAAAALAPGKTTLEIDSIARDHIRRAGYGDYFGHGLGHGMGMNGHEDPRMNPLYASMTLDVGHVVTVEPGIYLPGVGGVRIEDDYVITDTGAKNLCSMPKDIDWATL